MENPGLTTEQCLAAIAHHSAGLADAARGNLDARVEHCPDWDVADLVWHVTNVHWFWTAIAEQLPQELPKHLLGDENRPPRPADHEGLLAMFEAGARRLVEVLGEADQTARCWTWAPQQQDVAFITRHQVQEAAVHHWDAMNARGAAAAWTMDPDAAADAVEEFLTVSVSSEADPAEPARPPLDGAIWICACATTSRQSPTWLIRDGAVPGTVRWERLPDGVQPDDRVAEDVPMVGGHADPTDIVLWLYGRTDSPFIADPPEDPTLLDRFRALTFTG